MYRQSEQALEHAMRLLTLAPVSKPDLAMAIDSLGMVNRSQNLGDTATMASTASPALAVSDVRFSLNLACWSSSHEK
jgi:hypothetical protein